MKFQKNQVIGYLALGLVLLSSLSLYSEDMPGTSAAIAKFDSDLQSPSSLSYTSDEYRKWSLSSFHKGMKFFKKRKYKIAIPSLIDFAKQKTPIQDYGFYYIGRSYYKSSKYREAYPYFKRLRENHPQSRFLSEAIESEANCYFKLKEHHQLIKAFKSELIKPITISVKTRYLFYIGLALQKEKKYSEALVIYLQALTHLKEKKYIKKILKEISNISQITAINSKQPRFVQIGIGFYRLKNYTQAIAMLQKGKKLSDSNSIYQQLYYMGMSHLANGEFTKARWFLKQAMNQSSDDDKYIPAAYSYYKSFESKELSKAITGYKKIVFAYQSPYILKSAKALVNYYSQKNDDQNRLKYLAYVANYGEADALWSHLLSDLNDNQLRFIVTHYYSMANEMKDQELKAKYLYWLGVAALKLKNYSQAQTFFISSYYAYKYNYYSYKSLLYIKRYEKHALFDTQFSAIRNQSKTKEQVFLNSDEYKSRYKNSLNPIFSQESPNNLKRVIFLYEHGANKLAKEELERFLKTETYKEKYYRGLTYYFYSRGLNQPSIRFANRLINYLNGDGGHHYIPSDLIKYYYPKHYESVIGDMAEKYHVNPYLVFAVIREESRFNFKAHSWAGARGLMQIMPSTARYLARQEQMKKINLYDAKTNVKLGCRYLAQLIKKFDSYSYALASYNGGPGRMNSRLRSFYEMDFVLTGEHAIELISNSETRNYVKKVLNSYFCYLDLYNQID